MFMEKNIEKELEVVLENRTLIRDFKIYSNECSRELESCFGARGQ